jgi:CheY-like chemotaxis protein
VNVLVVDDDKGTRFAVSRILTQQFGLAVTECSDGLEALQVIAKRRFHFVVLDIEMPTMSGVEVLECMRESEATKSIPVVVLSGLRDHETVQHLLKLGVSDYILKPPRAEKILAKVQRLLSVLPRTQQTAQDGSALRLSSDSPALVVDGSEDFRLVLVNELHAYGPVQEADSGAAALARFRDVPVGLVFVGQDLGVVSPEMLVKRLRRMCPDGPLRIVGLMDDMSKVPDGVFDAVVQRTFLPTMLRAAIQSFVETPGPLNALRAKVPDIVELAVTAAAQSFGMMFEAEVSAAEADAGVETASNAVVLMDVEDRFSVAVGVHFTTEAATAVASKMFGSEPDQITDDDRTSVACDVCNLVVARVQANLSERELKSVCGQPQRSGIAATEPVPAGEGWLGRLTLDVPGTLLLSLRVVDHTAPARTAAPASPLTATPA